MINILTFNIVAAAVIIFLVWVMNDILPQVRYNRKLDKAAKLAEESSQRYWDVRESELTVEIGIPGWKKI